jgi:hypothetical protein
MGSYAQLRVGDLEIAHFKSEIEAWIALVFTADDWRSRRAGREELAYYGQDEPWEIVELAAPVSVIRDRLEVTGADWGTVATVFDEMIEARRASHHRLREQFSDEPIRESLEREIEYLTDFGPDDWVRALTNAPPDRPGASRLDLGTRSWLIDLWSYRDVRLCLRAVLECRRDGWVSVDATDLIEGGWLSPDVDPRESALLEFGWAQTHASPIVVLTEGSTDAKILETALDVIYPHLRGFIRFADFSHQPEANAAALVKTVKAFAAAGISNRVVALFDADTAAYDAVRSLDVGKLPPSLCIRHLPPTQLASDYPTIGPNGRVLADVNRKACSIELYLGRDVLTDAHGDLRPVRWTGFVKAIGAWQGEVEAKAAILAAFWAKARAAMDDPRAAAEQDWSDLRAIIDEVRSAFVTSATSPLSATASA